jgi:hypothetical protein
MSTTTVAVIADNVRAALDEVLAYALPAEEADYEAASERQRHKHIYRALRTVQQWVSAIPAEADTIAIKQALARQDYLLTIWHIDDVRAIRPDLSDGQCREVLEQADHRHDAEIGINWDVLRIWADELFPEYKG